MAAFLRSPRKNWRKQAKIIKHSYKARLGNIVLHHKKRLADFQYPTYLMQAIFLAFTTQLIKGKGTGHYIKDTFLEREMGSIRLNQEDVIIPSCLGLSYREHTSGKINPYDYAVSSDPFLQAREGCSRTGTNVNGPPPLHRSHMLCQKTSRILLLIPGMKGNKPVIKSRKKIIVSLSESLHV